MEVEPHVVGPCRFVQFIDKGEKRFDGFFLGPAVIVGGQTEIAEPLAFHKSLFGLDALDLDHLRLGRSIVFGGICRNGFSGKCGKQPRFLGFGLGKGQAHIGPVVVPVPGKGDAVDQGVAFQPAVQNPDLPGSGQGAQVGSELTELRLGERGASGNVQRIQSFGGGQRLRGKAVLLALFRRNGRKMPRPFGEKADVGQRPLPGLGAVQVKAEKGGIGIFCPGMDRQGENQKKKEQGKYGSSFHDTLL